MHPQICFLRDKTMILYNPVQAGFSLRTLSIACSFVFLTACTSLSNTPVENAPTSLIKTNPKADAEAFENTPDEKRTGKTLLEQRGTGNFSNAPTKKNKQGAIASAGGVNVNFESAPLNAV